MGMITTGTVVVVLVVAGLGPTMVKVTFLFVRSVKPPFHCVSWTPGAEMGAVEPGCGRARKRALGRLLAFMVIGVDPADATKTESGKAIATTSIAAQKSARMG